MNHLMTFLTGSLAQCGCLHSPSARMVNSSHFVCLSVCLSVVHQVFSKTANFIKWISIWSKQKVKSI